MPDEQPTVPVGEHCGPGPKVAAWVLGVLFLVAVGLAAFLWMRIGIADQQINALNASVQRLDNEKMALEASIDAMEDEQAMMEEEIDMLGEASVVLYRDSENDFRIETTHDCRNVWSIEEEEGLIAVTIPQSDTWSEGWYYYQVMSQEEFEQAQKERTSAGTVVMSEFKEGRLLVAFQPQDTASDDELLGISGAVCEKPIVHLPSGETVQGYR